MTSPLYNSSISTLYSLENARLTFFGCVRVADCIAKANQAARRLHAHAPKLGCLERVREGFAEHVNHTMLLLFLAGKVCSSERLAMLLELKAACSLCRTTDVIVR